MKKNVLIIAAPFGFGPASKALLIADVLKGDANITILTDGDAFAFVEKYRSDSTKGLKGIFSRLYPDEKSIGAFDFFVSVNNQPAVHHLARLGRAAQTVFHDSLLSWRANGLGNNFPTGLLAYLVQDYPGSKAFLGLCKAKHVALTAPLVWRKASGDESIVQGNWILHLGGMTSLLADWESILLPVLLIVSTVSDLAQRCGRTLTVIGGEYLRNLEIPRLQGIGIRGDVSPTVSASLIASSELVLTTPGIGAIYEAMASATPFILLPPMNSTQLFHYQILSSLGMPGSMSPEVAGTLFQDMAKTGWEQQTPLIIGWLNRNHGALLPGLPRWIDRLYRSTDCDVARKKILGIQNMVFDTLSKTSAPELIRHLVH